MLDSRFWRAIGLIAFLGGLFITLSPASAGGKKSDSPAREADVKALEKQAREFEAAFAKSDAKAPAKGDAKTDAKAPTSAKAAPAKAPAKK